MKKYLAILIALLLVLFTVAPVFATSNTAFATYLGTITITNTGATATNVAVPVTNLNIGNLITNNYLWSNCTNSAALIAGADIAYMPNSAINSTIIFVPSVTANQSVSAQLYTGGNQTMNSTLAYFPDTGGMTSLSFGSILKDYKIEIKGRFTNVQGATKYILWDSDGISVYQNAGNLGVVLFGGSSLSATGIEGEHAITIESNSTTITLLVDGEIKDTDTSVNLGVFDGPVSCASETMSYLEYQKVWVSGVLQQEIRWQNNATFTDLSGNGHDATPTFRTTSSNANVTATLSTYAPTYTAQLNSYSILGFGNVTNGTAPLIPELFDELHGTDDFIFGIGKFINDTLTAADILPAMFWFPVMYGIATVLALVTYRYLSGANRMLGLALELAVEVLWCCVFFTFGTYTTLPLWPVVVIFLPQGLAIIEASKNYGF